MGTPKSPEFWVSIHAGENGVQKRQPLMERDGRHAGGMTVLATSLFHHNSEQRAHSQLHAVHGCVIMNAQ
ncbi:hypothetical protein KDI_49030 [Dictyobacter arantiisoli]|uniref:Uncharacterized protein n=1 Tax=Dictyobacter arantiisoli TaxID=2014874 RepID=A0A5A5TJY4_9CHLR|nr:hypothetical protein KDI_49030 [Dictyobacter arantiisoli]